jgi:hypothetical protein
MSGVVIVEPIINFLGEIAFFYDFALSKLWEYGVPSDAQMQEMARLRATTSQVQAAHTHLGKHMQTFAAQDGYVDSHSIGTCRMMKPPFSHKAPCKLLIAKVYPVFIGRPGVYAAGFYRIKQ